MYVYSTVYINTHTVLCRMYRCTPDPLGNQNSNASEGCICSLFYTKCY